MNVVPDNGNPVTPERIALHQAGLRGEFDVRQYKKLTKLKDDFFSLYELKLTEVNYSVQSSSDEV